MLLVSCYWTKLPYKRVCSPPPPHSLPKRIKCFTHGCRSCQWCVGCMFLNQTTLQTCLLPPPPPTLPKRMKCFTHGCRSCQWCVGCMLLNQTTLQTCLLPPPPHPTLFLREWNVSLTVAGLVSDVLVACYWTKLPYKHVCSPPPPTLFLREWNVSLTVAGLVSHVLVVDRFNNGLRAPRTFGEVGFRLTLL